MEDDVSVGSDSKKRNTSSTCFVPKCTSGYNSNSEKVSLFTAPKDVELLQKWRNMIPRKDKVLQVHNVVCEKHFKEECIERHYRHVVNGSEVLLPRGKPMLIKGALPTEYPDLPTKNSNIRPSACDGFVTYFLKRIGTGGEEDAGLVANESKKRSNVNKFEKYFKSIDTSCQSEKDFLVRLREKNAKEDDDESDTDDSGASSDGSLNDISLEDYMNENLPKYSKNGPIEEKIGAMRSKLMATVLKRALKRALLESEIKSAHARRAYFDSKKSFLTPANTVATSSGMPVSFSDIKAYEDLKFQVMNEELAAKTEKRVLQKQLFEAEIQAATSKRGYYAAKKSTLLVPNDT